MEQPLSKNASVIQEALAKFQLECKVLELPDSTRTAKDAASSIGCEVAQIVKSLIFKTQTTNKPVLVLASGINQVSENKIENALGEIIVKADAEFVKNITGFSIGGIPPLGHKNKIDLIFLDQDLIAFDEVWAAAGTPNAVFCIKAKDLAEVTKGKIVSISRKDTSL